MSSHRHTAHRAAGIMIKCLVLTCTLSSLALAQKDKKKKECEPDDGESTELYSGRLFLQKVTDPKVDSTEKQDDLKGAINALAPHNRIHNDIGQAYLLGDALTLFVARRPQITTGPRSYFGFKENPDATVDILHMADSLITRLETQRPECVDWAHSVRQQAYVPIVNIAIRQLNDGQGDSAAASAQRSLEIYKSSPYAYNVLAGVAIKNNDYPSALTNYQKTIDLTDTSTNANYVTIKRGAQYNVAVITQQQAEADSGADRKAKIADALKVWKAYVAANPDDQNGKDGLTHSLQVAGDTLSAAQVSADMLVSPQKYQYSQIYNAAVTAASGKQWADAAKYFEATLVRNPYMRDALFYLSTTYLTLGDTTKIPPLIRRAIALDPNDPESYQLMAITYQSRSKVEKNPAIKKALTDTLLYYYTKYKDMKAHVTVNKFTRSADKLAFGGKVENSGPTDKTYTINFQFLDSTGTVVANQSTPPLTVPANSSTPFEMTIDKSGIFGYRYAPIDTVGIVAKP